MAIIDPRHLLQFHEIVRTGSFTRAAKTLGLTQPALTRNMKLMEGRLGFEVLVRSRQRIVPTTIGMRILEEAESVVMVERRISEFTVNFGMSSDEIIRIGCTPSASLTIMAEPLRQFVKQMPTTRFDVRSAPVASLVEQLSNGKIELAFGPMQIADQLPDSTGLEFFQSQMVIVAAARHPLARRSSVSVTDMKNQHWALHQPGTHLRGLSDKILDGIGISTNTALVTSLPASLILPLLEIGDHLSIVPHYSITKMKEIFRLIEPTNTKFAFGAIWNTDCELSPSAAKFVRSMNTLMQGLR